MFLWPACCCPYNYRCKRLLHRFSFSVIGFHIVMSVLLCSMYSLCHEVDDMKLFIVEFLNHTPLCFLQSWLFLMTNRRNYLKKKKKINVNFRICKYVDGFCQTNITRVASLWSLGKRMLTCFQCLLAWTTMSLQLKLWTQLK